jgi:hypothetical protein
MIAVAGNTLLTVLPLLWYNIAAVLVVVLLQPMLERLFSIASRLHCNVAAAAFATTFM